jgi:Tfp pilus assembly protein PilN
MTYLLTFLDASSLAAVSDCIQVPRLEKQPANPEIKLQKFYVLLSKKMASKMVLFSFRSSSLL